MAIDWHARALDVLAQDYNDCDSDKIVLEIAKRNPSVLVRAVEAIHQRERWESRPWWGKFSELVRQGQMVRAVKLHREKTGSTLKEAKEAYNDELARVRGEEVGQWLCSYDWRS